jgi:streptogramin lyase
MGSPVIFNGPYAKVLPSGGIKLKSGTVISDATYFKKDGTVPMTGALDLGTANKIINLANPTLNQDAATKFYVDSSSGAIGAFLADGTVPMTGDADFASFDINNLNKISSTNLNYHDIQSSYLGAVSLPAPAFSTSLLFGPRGFAQDSAGNTYVSESSNARILKVDTRGVVSTLLTSVTVFGMACYGDYLYTCQTSGSIGRFKLSDSTYNASFSTGITSPYGMCVDSTGTYAYVASVGLNAVVRIDLSNGTNSIFISTIAGSFGTVSDVCIDTTDTYLYASDYAANDIKRIAVATSTVVILSLSGATTTTPYGITIDSTGSVLYMTCHAGSQKAVKIILNGTSGLVYDLVTFIDVFHIYLDASELFVLVSVFNQNAVQRVLLSTNVKSDWLGNLSAGAGSTIGTTHYPVAVGGTKINYSADYVVFNNERLTNIANPILDKDAVTKTYSDHLIQPTPSARSGSFTVLNTDMLSKIVVATPTGAVGYQLQTNTELGSYTPLSVANNSFNWTIINTSAFVVTLSGNTGHTIVGSLSIAADSSASLRTRFVSTGVYITYRI